MARRAQFACAVTDAHKPPWLCVGCYCCCLPCHRGRVITQTRDPVMSDGLLDYPFFLFNPSESVSRFLLTPAESVSRFLLAPAVRQSLFVSPCSPSVAFLLALAGHGIRAPPTPRSPKLIFSTKLPERTNKTEKVSVFGSSATGPGCMSCDLQFEIERHARERTQILPRQQLTLTSAKTLKWT